MLPNLESMKMITEDLLLSANAHCYSHCSVSAGKERNSFFVHISLKFTVLYYGPSCINMFLAKTGITA